MAGVVVMAMAPVIMQMTQESGGLWWNGGGSVGGGGSGGERLDSEASYRPLRLTGLQRGELMCKV